MTVVTTMAFASSGRVWRYESIAVFGSNLSIASIHTELLKTGPNCHAGIPRNRSPSSHRGAALGFRNGIQFGVKSAFIRSRTAATRVESEGGVPIAATRMR